MTAARVAITTGTLHEARAALALQARELVAWPEEAGRLAGAIRSAGLSVRREAGTPGGPIVAVAGARGGLGTTTIAAWLAVALKAVALVELDAAGSLANFDVDPVPTLGRLLEGGGPEGTRRALRDSPIGVPVAFPDPGSREPTSEQIRSLLVSLRTLDGPCVVDVGRAYGPRMAALQEADLGYLVVAEEVGCVRSLTERRLIGTSWVRRKQSRRSSIPLNDLERALGSAPVATIDQDSRVGRDADIGKLSIAPASIMELVAHTRGDSIDTTGKAGLLARARALVEAIR